MLQTHVITQQEYNTIHGGQNARCDNKYKANRLLQTIHTGLKTSKNGDSFTSLVKTLENSNRPLSHSMAERMVQIYSKILSSLKCILVEFSFFLECKTKKPGTTTPPVQRRRLHRERITLGFAVAHKRILKVLGGLALCLLVIWFLKDYVVSFSDEDKLTLRESTANDQGAPTTSDESRTCDDEHRTSNKEDGNMGRTSEEGDDGRASGKGGTVDEGVTDDEGRTSEDGRTSSDTDENDECKIVTNTKGEETANNVLLEWDEAVSFEGNLPSSSDEDTPTKGILGQWEEGRLRVPFTYEGKLASDEEKTTSSEEMSKESVLFLLETNVASIRETSKSIIEKAEAGLDKGKLTNENGKKASEEDCYEVNDLNLLFDYLYEIADWVVLCSRLRVKKGTIAGIQNNPKITNTLYSCLEAFVDLGEPYSCWEKVVSTVCGPPFIKKRLGKTIATDLGIALPSECT